MAESIKIHVPLTKEEIEKLHAGDHVLMSGAFYSARDAAHRRMMAALDKGEELPVDLRGQLIYYVGPTPARPGRVIGAAGPTTSMRLDPFTPRLLEYGIQGTIGKGGRGPAVREALKKHKGIYFIAIGGAGALLSRTIKKVDVVAYEDLGTEAMRRIEVEDFPAVVVDDIHGNDLLEEGKAQYQRREELGSYEPVGPVGGVNPDGGGR